MMPDDDDWLEKALAEYEREEAHKVHRKKHSYVADLIRLLMPHERGLTRQMVLHDLERQRYKEGLPVPPKFVEAVQSSYNYFSVDSLVFKKRGGRRDEELFYSPEGKGSGRWAVNREVAAVWLQTRLNESEM